MREWHTSGKRPLHRKCNLRCDGTSSLRGGGGGGEQVTLSPELHTFCSSCKYTIIYNSFWKGKGLDLSTDS